MPTHSLVAVDVGNARIKLGLFGGGCAAGLPEPATTLALVGNEPNLDAIATWLAAPSGPIHQNGVVPGDASSSEGALAWWIASVNRPATTRLIDWLNEHRRQDRIGLLAAGDLPLEVRLPRPDMVGIDRLIDALAANRLREPGRVAVIVDVGSAITVDLLSPKGAFLGGAILPGIAMAARALHQFTDLLPLVDASDFHTPPPALGTATEAAMTSGLFWGAVGAIRQLVEQLARTGVGGEGREAGNERLDEPPQVFLTGGAGTAVAELIGPDTRFLPNLTLAGIAVAAGSPHPSPTGEGR